MKNNSVNVRLWGTDICRLEWRGGYKPNFGKLGAVVSFHPDYGNTPWDLDPLGPYNKSIYLVRTGLSDWCRATEYEGIPRFISCSLPDDWGNEVFSTWAASNHIKHSDITAVDKLAFIGNRAMGALEFIPSLYKASEKDVFVLEQLYDAARKILESREALSINLGSNPGINELMTVGMSAGGMHPKAIIAINWETGEVKSGQVPLPEGFTHYLLKFNESTGWPSAEIEYTYYKMAEDAGIDMTPCRLIQIEGDNHFLTERFDRKNGEKIHTATLNSLCGDTHDYEDIFMAARRLNVPHNDIERLFRMTVFNYLSGVCDDHDKNFSFTMDRFGKWRLAPAYDVTFTVNFKNRFIGNRHAMSISGKNRYITKDDLLRLADNNDINAPAGIISQVTDILRQFPAYAGDMNIDNVFSNYIESHIKEQLTLMQGAF